MFIAGLPDFAWMMLACAPLPRPLKVEICVENSLEPFQTWFSQKKDLACVAKEIFAELHQENSVGENTYIPEGNVGTASQKA